jgi:tetratricopeptide (TPR) repeat protein
VPNTETPEQAPDFFISRAGADAAFAAEIGRILEAEGNTVVLQQWDFSNHNFMERMHRALASGARVIALLSNDYLASDHCEAEWQNAIAHEPLNRNGRLIVLRVAESTPIGLLTALAYWDLVPVRGDPALLRDIILTAIQPGRHKDLGAIGEYWRAPRPVVHPEIRPTSSFTGRRAELEAIHALLWSGQAAAITQPVAARGLGGIGKSALAREYAYQHQSDYAGVWWLNAARPADGAAGFEGVERALVELGAIFIRGLEEAKDRGAAARRAMDLIAHGGFEKPWLLVYDNADAARVLREWPPIGNVHVLMTTRIGGWPVEIRTVEVEEWTLQEAISYLRAESGRSDLTEAEAGEVAEALGRLPLALSHAAALLRARPNITAAAYIEQLARRMNEAPRDAEYPRAVFATFQEALAEAEREAPGAAAVMSLAALFAPDDIPEELFRQPPECYPPALAERVRTLGAVDEAIGALAHLSLVDFHPASRTFSAHRLVLAAARHALGGPAPPWSRSALQTLASAFPAPEDPRTWPVCERLVSHARAVATQITEDSPALARLLGIAGIYLQERAALAEVLALYERAYGISSRLAADNPGDVGLQHDLSVAHVKIGDARSAQGHLGLAFESYRAALAILEPMAVVAIHDADWQRDLSIAYSKIGGVLYAQGNLGGALERYRTSLAIMERLATADPSNFGWQRDLSLSHISIGDVQRDQGNLGLALESYRSFLAISERLTAADSGNREWRRDLAVAHDRVGDVHKALGNPALALNGYRASVRIREHLARADPGNLQWQRDLSVSREKIGDVQLAERKLEAALDSYSLSLEIRQRLAMVDPDNAGWQRDLSLAREKIGDVLSAQGNLGQALEGYRASLAISELLLAADPSNAGWQRDLSVSHDKIGRVLNAQGNLDGALKAYQDGLAIAEKLAAQDPGNAEWQRDLALSYGRIAAIDALQGERERALVTLRKGRAIIARLRQASPDHVTLASDLAAFDAEIARLAG